MSPEFLRANLCFLHGIMTASEGLLRAAIVKTADDDLADYFSQHLVEETGHLQMLEADLKALKVQRIPKFPIAAQLAGAQYYYIEHDHPALLLGYMFALESNAPTPAQISVLESEHGPLLCSRHHAEHDSGHTASLKRQIEALAPDLKTRVIENQTWVLRDIQERVIPVINAASHYFKVIP